MSCLTEHLLEIIYTYPILYDLNNKDYKNIRKKDKIWDDIGTTLNTSGEELKKKWKNLRDSYMKYLRCIKPTTGQAKKNYKAWSWASQMDRFKPFLGNAKTVSNVTNETQEEGFIIEMDDEPDGENNKNCIPPSKDEVVHTEPNLKKRKQHSSGSSSNVDKVVEYLEGKNKSQLDATDHLMLGYAKTIKTFTRARQAEIKLKFAQLINRAEMEQIREENLSTPASSSGTWDSSNHSCAINYPNDEDLEEQRLGLYKTFVNLG